MVVHYKVESRHHPPSLFLRGAQNPQLTLHLWQMIVKDLAFTLTNILVLLVVDFQHSLGSNKTKPAHCCTFQRRLNLFKKCGTQKSSDGREKKSTAECSGHGYRIRRGGERSCAGASFRLRC